LRVNTQALPLQRLTYHFVFVTTYRRKCFTGAMLDRLKDVVATLCEDWEAEPIEMSGEDDPVRFLLGLNAKCAPSVVAKNFKTATSRLLRKEFQELRAKFKEPVLWSPSDFVASIAVRHQALHRAGSRAAVAPLAGASSVRRFTTLQAGRLRLGVARAASPPWMDHCGAIR